MSRKCPRPEYSTSRLVDGNGPIRGKVTGNALFANLRRALTRSKLKFQSVWALSLTTASYDVISASIPLRERAILSVPPVRYGSLNAAAGSRLRWTGG
jgi:hypothetical protein